MTLLLCDHAHFFVHPSIHRRVYGKTQSHWGNIRTPRSLVCRAGSIDDEDLLQHPERIKWYESKFVADDMPDWSQGRFIGSEDVAPGLRNVVLQCEISRERVPLRNAYKAVGQRASVRVNGGGERLLTVSSAPFSHDANRLSLFKVRGDLFAHEIKVPREPISVKGQFHVLVSREEALDVWELGEDDVVEVGPFRGSGLDLRGSGIMAVYRFPTLVVFTSGRGIAHVHALFTSSTDVANLTPKLRRDIRVYYKVPNSSSACYVGELRALRQTLAPGCTFDITVTTSSFSEAFDEDNTLMYDPDNTAALILTGGDEVAEAEALETCREAEITTVLCDSQGQAPPVYLDPNPPGFMSWKGQHGAAGA